MANTTIDSIEKPLMEETVDEIQEEVSLKKALWKTYTESLKSQFLEHLESDFTKEYTNFLETKTEFILSSKNFIKFEPSKDSSDQLHYMYQENHWNISPDYFVLFFLNNKENYSDKVEKIEILREEYSEDDNVNRRIVYVKTKKILVISSRHTIEFLV